ncbi:hypothetical protein Ahy_A07g036398 [Arachis hypogaea]|uniref:Transposase-associated domain-containing protein n=1 Tax=Arachis hypogaea TaxID=3818 RepID=A0A445CG16_ARAHY|nr:hypothetical protein Ahy_A07g036398 [Arachis hypogaea]
MESITDIDKSWISKSQVGAEYRNSLTRFLDFAFANASSDGMIRCPCPKCGFHLLQNREDAFNHLVINPFPSSYTFWIYHSERRRVESSCDGQENQSKQNFNAPMLDMVHEAFNFSGLPGHEEDSENEHDGGRKLRRKLEERDLFLCASSILFCKVMVEASLFSSMEHTTSFVRDLWFNTLPIQSWMDTFSAHRHIGDATTIAHGDIRTGLLQFATKYHKKFGFGFVTSTNLFLSQQILEEVQARYKNNLNVELEIASRKEFTLIKRGLARKRTQEVPEETGEIVQDSMLEEDVVPDIRKDTPGRSFYEETHVDTTCQQPQRADCRILLPGGSSSPASSSLRPFHPPHKPDGTIKQVKLSVKEAMKPPNGRKIVLRFNSALQPVGDEAGLLSGVMGLLGSDYTKFPICEKDRRKVHTKDKVYNECVKEMFHFEEDSRGIVKRIIFKMLGRAWKETRNRLYHHCYDSELSLEENIKNHPDRITTDHWRWFLDYRNSKETHLYTHTGRSKSFARFGEEKSERQGKRVSRGELYLLTHKRANDSYVHDAAWTIGERIEAIEQHDESSRLLSQNDSLAQALGKEHPGRVRGMGLGPTSSQPSNDFEREETQRVLLELQAELAAEKLKRKIVEDEVAVEKTKRQAVEDGVAAEKIKRQTVEDEVAAGKVRI